jgi:hypothetical protein
VSAGEKAQQLEPTAAAGWNLTRLSSPETPLVKAAMAAGRRGLERIAYLRAPCSSTRWTRTPKARWTAAASPIAATRSRFGNVALIVKPLAVSHCLTRASWAGVGP